VATGFRDEQSLFETLNLSFLLFFGLRDFCQLVLQLKLLKPNLLHLHLELALQSLQGCLRLIKLLPQCLDGFFTLVVESFDGLVSRVSLIGENLVVLVEESLQFFTVVSQALLISF